MSKNFAKTVETVGGLSTKVTVSWTSDRPEQVGLAIANVPGTVLVDVTTLEVVVMAALAFRQGR